MDKNVKKNHNTQINQNTKNNKRHMVPVIHNTLFDFLIIKKSGQHATYFNYFSGACQCAYKDHNNQSDARVILLYTID